MSKRRRTEQRTGGKSGGWRWLANRSPAAILLAAALCAGSAPGAPARAAGPFDGWWAAHAPAKGTCPDAWFQVIVADGEIGGTVSAGARKVALSGSVQEDGTALVTALGLFADAVFVEDEVTLTFSSACGDRVAVGERV